MNQRESRRSVIDLYLAEIVGCRTLTREQEASIARAAGKSGRRRDLNKLIEPNLPFVVKIAKEYRNLGLPFEDLLNEGNLGLIKAARRYDPGKGVKFITYAVWWIRKTILDALHNQTGIVRVPRYSRNKASRIRKAEGALSRELGRTPGRGELSSRLYSPVTEIDLTLLLQPREIPLDQELWDGGPTVGDSIPDEQSLDPESRLLIREAHHLARWAFSWLTDQERSVVSKRFGLDQGRIFTLKEIGEELGLTRERIRQIEARGLARLRRILGSLLSCSPELESGPAGLPPRLVGQLRRWKARRQNGNGTEGRNGSAEDGEGP